jgi:hypothetical protein
LKCLSFFLIFILLFSQSILLRATDIPRHLDPSTLDTDNPNPNALFGVYSDIYTLIAAHDYSQANKILSSIEDIDASEENQLIISNYNSLLQELIEELNQTEKSIIEAYSHIAWLREKKAEESLIDALPHIKSANESSKILESSSYTLSNALSGQPNALLEGQDEVETLLENLNERIVSGMRQVEEIVLARLEGLYETRIRAIVDDFNPWVGSTITVSGSLTTTEDLVLSDKRIEIMFGGFTTYAVSNSEGRFEVILEVPVKYVEYQELRIIYWPDNEDQGLYSPATVSFGIRPRFMSPNLSISFPDYLLPGIQYRVDGTVLYDEPIKNSKLVLSIFNQELVTSSEETGDFSFFINVPENAPEGAEKMKVTVNPNGVYGPGETIAELIVKKLPITIELDSAPLRISGQNIKVSGTVSYMTQPLFRSIIKLHCGQKSFTTLTKQDGKFDATIPLTIISPSQRQFYTVSVTPREPWMSSGTVKGSFLMINSLTMISLSTLLLVIVIKKRPIKPEKHEELEPLAQKVEYPIKKGLQGIYIKALSIIKEITGEKISSSSTINEFVNKIKPGLTKRIYNYFKKLSTLYERWLYGPSKKNPPLLKSQDLLDRMEEDE